MLQSQDILFLGLHRLQEGGTQKGTEMKSKCQTVIVSEATAVVCFMVSSTRPYMPTYQYFPP